MRQGEIWEINLSPAVGSEIKKNRPAVIINDNPIGILPLKVIVPITAWKNRYHGAIWMIRIDPDSENKLSKISAIDTFQIRSISTKRLVRKVGSASSNVLDQVKTAIKAVIDAD